MNNSNEKTTRSTICPIAKVIGPTKKSDDNTNTFPDFSNFVDNDKVQKMYESQQTEISESESISNATYAVSSSIEKQFPVTAYSPDVAAQIERIALSAAEEAVKQVIRTSSAFTQKQISDKQSLETYAKKLTLKAQFKELERAQREEIIIDNDGKPVLARISTIIPLEKLEITNMRYPTITLYRCADELDLFCYCLNCEVKGQKKQVFLAPEKIAPSVYLQKKLGAAGISFQYKPYYHTKQILFDFITGLIGNCTDTLYIPLRPGWFTPPGCEPQICEEGELTWTIIMTQLK